MKKVIALAATAALLASCATTSGDAQVEALKAYDKVCKAEPPLYASFVAIATAKKVSEKTLLRAEGLHNTITNMCEVRPLDAISALVILSASYAQFVAISAAAQK